MTHSSVIADLQENNIKTRLHSANKYYFEVLSTNYDGFETPLSLHS